MYLNCFRSFSIIHSPPSDLTRGQPPAPSFSHSQFEAFSATSVVLQMVALLQVLNCLARERAVKSLRNRQSRFKFF